MATEPMSRSDLSALAAEAFVYGYPILADLDKVAGSVRGTSVGVPTAPFNQFGHAAALAGPDMKFVSINNDTIYSCAMVDTSGGPVRFDVPDADGRYYVMQFVDAWTNNFAYVGHRATGTEAGSFLLVPPGWAGDAPENVTVIHCPTTVVSIVGRWAVDGESDLPAVKALQSELRLTPTGTGRGLPTPATGVPDDLLFFEQLRVAMAAFPPAERDRRYQRRFAPIGLLSDESPYISADPDFAGALRDGLAEGRKNLESELKHASAPMQNGWNLTYHIFDYNLDFFEVGALDDPDWKLPDTPARYTQRTAAARGGLWGNHGYEAAYAMVYVDGDSAALDGTKRYELTFTTPPPCGAFWSITMYDAEDFYLVDNPIDRYSIGDRTPGLVTAPDGSLTITLQHDQPTDPTVRANWLPTPAGPFRPLLRVYEPDPSVLDGSYELPPITRQS
ncbi:DUF1254 domain-containing protein [Nocardia caishijiensis]|uniref:DUF1254 domain-containing protein n=1 Tax=Nocardia caishijiensis TaxID=184756 RepID=A0ABQ6YQR4_9NOCA|nr:DUF1254 domain-containing protein [Nocardia caishijiensis]KAF0848129.1 hypothetical protein FNL39_102276 [Nocardia caishijiensis]